MSAHTPGPWEAVRINSQEWTVDAPKGDPKLGYTSWEGLAVVHGSTGVEEAGELVAQANARLVAASPDLLAYAEIEEARSRGEDAAKAALQQHGWHESMGSAQDFVDQMRRAAIAKAVSA